MKVKAHQNWKGLSDLTEKEAFIGNDLADEAANKGARLHPQPAEGERTCADFEWKLAKELTKAVGKILQLFPTVNAGQGRQRLKKRETEEAKKKKKNTEQADYSFSVEPDRRHTFQRRGPGSSFFCTRCFASAFSQQSAAARQQKQACTGEHPTLKRAVESGPQLGHSLLVAVQHARPTVLCRLCGAMASAHRHSGLFQPCLGRPASDRAREGLRRTQRGRHPDPRKPGELDLLCRATGTDLEPISW